MRLPRNWALSMGLLAAVPSLVAAGPFDRKAEPAAEKGQSGSNQQVADDVKSALQAARPKGKGIQIEVRNGVASISGSISDSAERARVTQAVSQVPGVKQVDNRLVLMSAAPKGGSGIEQAGFTGDRRGPIQQVGAASPAEAPFREAAAPAPASYAAPAAPASYAAPAGSNQEVAQSIGDALAGCGLQGYDIEVRYKQGTCSLIGAVEAREQAMAAERAARSVPGVQQVLNRLTVNGQLAAPPAPRGPIAPTAGMQGPGGYPQGYPQGPQGYPQGPQGMGPQGMMQAQAQGMAPPQAMMGPEGAPPMGPGGMQQAGHHMLYNQPNVPQYAWPTYAQNDNYAAVTYPSQYDASAWPYMGPFYPYPQVPLNWRQATLEWDDGNWSLRFSPRTDKWWWFVNPHNWH